MGRSRSLSPSRRRSERDRDRRGERRRRRSRSRSRTRSRDRDRDRHHRHHSSKKRSSYSRSRSRERRNDYPGGSSKHHKSNSSGDGGERPAITAADLAGKSVEEQEMMRMMGFCNFDTTKGKKVTANNVGEVHVILKRKYRQYMNRKGGFNRPLDFVA